MIWMLSAQLVSLLFGVAASSAERALRASGRPGRWPWLLAPLLSILWLASALTGWTPWALLPSRVSARANVIDGAVGTAPLLLTGRTLIVLWCGLVTIFGALFLAQLWKLRRRRRGWRRGRVAGVQVLISMRTGPATIGWVRPRIVLPRWVLDLDARARRLVVLHEQEHRVAGDVLLLNVAALLVVLMPWNLALWWHAARLHRAIELDCDARVLRRAPDRARYGRVLLEAAARSAPAPVLAAGLGRRRPLLERRLSAMVSELPPRGARLAACGAFVLAVAACVMPSPFAPDERENPIMLRELGGVLRARGVAVPTDTAGRYEYEPGNVIREAEPVLRARELGGVVTRVSPPPTDPTARR